MRWLGRALLALTCLAAPCAPALAINGSAAHGAVMLIGGGEDQDDLMRTFARLSSAPKELLVVIPLASDDPARSGQAYVSYMKQLGFANVRYLVPHGEPDAAALALLAHAGGLFFSGGDQARLLKGLTPGWRRAIADAWQQGALVAGTSAGAMVWGRTVILDGDPLETARYGDDPKHAGIRLGTGLGLFAHIVADTHFSQRGRVPRLAYAVAKQPGSAGIGVDPETAAIFYLDGRLGVQGRGTVTVIHVPAQTHALGAPLSLSGVQLDILAAGNVLPLPESP